MSPTDAAVPRPRREALRAGWIMLLSALTLIPLTVWHQVREPDTAVEVVTAFMEAVREGDLDRAYRFIDAGVPSGEGAAFLHPDAIGEWDLLEVASNGGSYSFEESVRVTIGTDEGTASGAFTVSDDEGEYTIVDPFQTVTVVASSYLSLQVNDRTVPTQPETTWAAWYSGQTQRSVQLLPGVYRFFGGDPVALLGDQDEAVEVGVPLPEPTEEGAASLQSAVEDLIDSCVAYRLTVPTGCPFATDGLVDTTERRRLEEIEDPSWRVEEYPVADVVPGTGPFGEPVLLVEFTEPGRLTLQGTGTEDWDSREEFTAACRFDGAGLHVLTDVDGSVQVAPLGETATDTCRGTE